MKYNLSSAHNFCPTSTSKGELLYDAIGNVNGYCHGSGVVIKVAGTGENTEGVYYTVSTYIGWSMPFLNGLLSLNGNNDDRDIPIGIWEISGQTRLIINE